MRVCKGTRDIRKSKTEEAWKWKNLCTYRDDEREEVHVYRMTIHLRHSRLPHLMAVCMAA